MAEETVKLNLNDEVTSRLSIEPVKDSTGGYLFGGLCPVYFEGAAITTQKPVKGQFKDIELKVLNLEFSNFKLNSTDPDRFLTHQEKVIGGVKKAGNDYAALDDKIIKDLVKNMWGRIKHIIDVTKGLPNWSNIAENKKFVALVNALPITTDAQKLADAYNALFVYLADFINGEAGKNKGIFMTVGGKPVTCWVKVLPEYNEGKWFTIPTYVGKGFIEQAKFTTDGDLLPANIIKVAPSESLELSSNKKNSVPGLNQGMPVVAGTTLPGGIANALGIKKQ